VAGGWEIERVEANPPLCAAPDLANVSFAASMSATALREAINAPYILWVMARTNSLVNEQHCNDATAGLSCPQTHN
jgi:hypothetical protein